MLCPCHMAEVTGGEGEALVAASQKCDAKTKMFLKFWSG